MANLNADNSKTSKFATFDSEFLNVNTISFN